MKKGNPIRDLADFIQVKRLDGSPAPHDTPDVLSNDWAALAFRPLVISGLVTCIAAGWISSIKFFVSDWQGDYLIPLVAVVTLEMLLVEQKLREHRLDVSQRLQVRLGEMVLLLLLLKPATYLSRGWVAFLTDSQRWLHQPGTFLDGDYMIGAMVLLLMWPLSIDIAGCLVAMRDAFSPPDRVWGLAGLKDRFIVGAFVLLMAMGARRVILSPLGPALRPVQPSASMWLPLLYLGLGLLLFGQGRLALLQAVWEKEQVPVTPILARRWAGWGVLFVGGVIVLALLMPAGDTVMGLFLLLWLTMLVTWAVQILLFILTLVLMLLLAPCMWLFKAQQIASPNLPQLQLAEAPPGQVAGPAWLFYLRLVVFWVVVATIAFFLMRIYWRERNTLGGWSIWSGLIKLWQALWAWLMGWKNRISVQFGRRAVEPAVKLPKVEASWWQSWRARTARERVRRFYLALLRRAAQAGHPRRPHQTPSEYTAALKPHVVGEENALDTLTGAFIEARYSRRDFQHHEVSFLRQIWERLQAVLRKR